jgi:hypothetical protein
MMRHLLVSFTILVTLVILPAGVIMAQTTAPKSPALSERSLRRQDHQECTAQAGQQNIAKRNQAEFVRKCMADRRGARAATLQEGGPNKWTREKIAAAKKRWAEDKKHFDECQQRLTETRKTKRLSVYRQVDFLEHCMIGQP